MTFLQVRRQQKQLSVQDTGGIGALQVDPVRWKAASPQMLTRR